MAFATYVDAPESSARTSRLIASSIIACSTLTLALSVAWTLERMSILRVPGPRTSFELAAIVVAEPPKPVEPPIPPDPVEIATDGGPVELSIVEPPTDDSEVVGDIADPGQTFGKSTGIPTGKGNGKPCAGGICPTNPIGTGLCMGPNCKQGEVSKAPPPREVSYASLKCIACADPDQAQLRKTAAGIRKSDGTNTTHFCVDERGRVESSSVKTTRSQGDANVDRVCRDTVKGWRFSPIEVGGEARRSCSQARFEIRFE